MQEIVDSIYDSSQENRKPLSYKQLQMNQETFERMRKAYEQLFERQEEFPFMG